MPADALTLPVAGKPSKLSLLGMPAAQLVEFFENIGEKPYRARQIMRWLYQRYVTEYAEMTDLSAALRKQLAEMTTLALPPVLKHEHSDDGTRKWLLDVGANQAVETVYIPEPDRGTLCISSQAGCALDCAFCATGYQGFNRNLTSAEILGQVVLAARELAPAKITNVVFMGMGEPLANYRNVLPVVHLLHRRPGVRPVAPPRDDQHGRRRAADAEAGRRLQRRARRIAARADRRAARQARADQQGAPDRRAARRVLEVRRGAGEPQHHVRVRACSTASTIRSRRRASS